jgi:hypothetical protein
MMVIMRILVFCALASAAVAAQSVAPAQEAPKRDSTVQVRGCLQGQTLTLTEDPGFIVPGGRLDLRGDRRIMRALKEHNGHIEEIVGVLKMQSGRTAVAVKEKRGEKTRVYIGVSEDRPKPLEAVPATPIIEVRAFSLIGPKCR